jgi:hypothetical protein
VQPFRDRHVEQRPLQQQNDGKMKRSDLIDQDQRAVMRFRVLSLRFRHGKGGWSMDRTRHHGIEIIPTRRQRHHSYDENVDEPKRLIENEPVEVEAEIPAERDQSVERSDPENNPTPPAFEAE